MMHSLFVFGTLKRGFPLHTPALADANLIGLFRTVERYPMVVAGPWFAPMMMNEPGTGLRIAGELYEIDEARLALIDALESIGKPGNFRCVVQIESIQDGRNRAAYAYMKAAELANPRHTGYLENYQDNRFVPPDRRPKPD